MQNKKINKSWMILLAAALSLIAIMPLVFALGVTPGRTTIIFEPNLEKNISFLILNSAESSIKVGLSSTGELGRHISFSEDSFSISTGGEKQASALLRLPNELSPGVHKAQIIISEIFSERIDGETFVRASASVITEVNVVVPYPGKYAEADIYALASKDNKEVDFTIPIVNRGKLGIEKAKATIEIYDSSKRKISSLSTNEISIATGERGEVFAKWEGDISPGEYSASATLIYDDKVLTLEKDFSVGSPMLEIEQIAINDFTLGGIAKFEVMLANKWNEELRNTYSTIAVYDTNGELLDEFKSPLYDISPMEKNIIVSYWDTTGVKKGIYDAVLTIRYGENSIDRKIKLDIAENSIQVIGAGYAISSRKNNSQNVLVMFLAVLIIMLILINVLWFLFMRKKLSRRRK